MRQNRWLIWMAAMVTECVLFEECAEAEVTVVPMILVAKNA